MVSAKILSNPDLAGPRIVLGDFNEWWHGLATSLLSRHFKSADRYRGYPGLVPFLHLDHIYYDGPLQLESARLHKTPASLLASDHLPLVGDFQTASGRQPEGSGFT